VTPKSPLKLLHGGGTVDVVDGGHAEFDRCRPRSRSARAVCDLADAAGAVLQAVTEGTARIHAYQRAGFTVHHQVYGDHEPCALLMRWPHSGGKRRQPTSSARSLPVEST
jgi:hypothetical protein